MISIIENFFSRKQNENLELKKKKEQSKKEREASIFNEDREGHTEGRQEAKERDRNSG